MRAFGYRQRHVIADDGLSRLYELQRLRCDVCRSVQLWIPTFIRVGKYYDDKTIHEAVTGSSDSCPAEDSTIRRWRRAAELQPVLPVRDPAPDVGLSRTAEKEEKQ